VLPRKPVDTPKASVPKAAEDDSKVLPFLDSIVVEDVLLLVRGLGKDPHHMGIFPEAAEGFLGLFRSSTFIEGYDNASYKAHECPVAHPFRNDTHPVLEQDKRVSKRGRKKDGDGSGGSSIKRKKREKTSPAGTLGSGISITPAIPIRQVKAEDIRTLMKAGSSTRGIIQDEKSKPSLFKCPISAAVPGATKPGQEQVQENDKSVLEKSQGVGNTLPEETAKYNEIGGNKVRN
jgi:ataxia telangiectasia mutated family protein